MLALVAPLALAAGGCGGADVAAIRFVGLADAGCSDALQALYGKVPIRVVPVGVGAGALDRVELSIGGTTLDDKDAPFEFVLDTTALTDGTTRLTATGHGGGDAITETIQVCVDNGGPALTIHSPSPGATITVEEAALAVRVRVTDPAGVADVRARLTVSGSHHRADCAPPGAREQVCSLRPESLGLSLPPGTTTTAELVVLARDAVGHETEVSQAIQVGTRLAWTHAVGAMSWGAVPLKGDALAVGTDSGKVVILTRSGKKRCSWTAPAVLGKPDGVAAPMSASADGKTLYLVTTNAAHALDTATCKQVWAKPPARLFYGSRPVVDTSAGVVYVGSYGGVSSKGALLAIGASSGKVLDKLAIAKVQGAVSSSPSLSADRKTVYIGSSDRNVYAVDVEKPAAMAQRWAHQVAGAVGTRPLVAGTRVYVAGAAKAIAALDAATGQPAAGFSFAAKAGFLSGPTLGSTGLLYAGSLDATLYAFDSAGKTVASFASGRLGRARPTLGPGEIVFAVRRDPGTLHALTARLQPLWSARPGLSQNLFLGTPAVRWGLVFVGGTNGTLYAYDASPPAS